MGFWPVVLNVLKNSDVVLLLADARMPDLTQNTEITKKVELMKGKRIILLFNKCDLISEKEKENIKKRYQGAYLISGKKKTGIKRLKEQLENMAENWIRPSIRIGIVGYPNVGKSTLINLLAPGAKAKISSVSGTTKKTQWIRTGRIRIMDSPGVIPHTDKAINVGITGAKNPHKIKNPERIAIELIERLRKQGSKALQQHYNVEAETDYELLLAIGKKRGYLLKKGEIDEQRTAITIIEDWQKGNITMN